jgi:hypothetical protein
VEGIGVSNPAAIPGPAAISAVAAIRACWFPGRIPMLSNHLAVPEIRPPEKILL